jgi:lysophospholipase L1-like esterase
MIHLIPCSGRLSLLIAPLALLANATWAAPVFQTAQSGPFTPSTTTDEVAFAADVSSSDLLHGIVGTGGSWMGGTPASPAGLNDGIAGGDYDANGLSALSGATWAVHADTFREFVLGPGANGLGYNITEIQTIAAWSGAGFSNQKYDVSVRFLGDASYTFLTTVEYQPFTTALTEGGSTKANVTDDTGTLASGVEAIRFDLRQTVSNTAGGVVMREIDVFGAATIGGPDLDPPTLDTLASVVPTDGATDVPVSINLEATFSEPIALTGTGTITLKNLSGGADIPVALPGDVSISGAVLTINPPLGLAASQEYAVEISNDAIEDLADPANLYAGLLATDTPNWSFTTGVPDLTAPTLDTLTSVVPADGATAVPLAANLEATFSEPIALTGVGSITLKNLSGGADIAISLPGDVSISGAVLTIDPPSNLVAEQEYAIEISGDAIEDLAEPANAYAGLLATDTPNWSFTAATKPLRIMCLGDSITVGYTDNPSWANHPFMFGYRSGLYTRLTNAGYNFLFVGASTEPWTGISGDPTNGGTYTPELDLRDFGQDGHRGYGGAGIWNNVNAWIDADDPDIILLLIGINGISTGSPTALNTLVNNIVTHAPDVHVVVAQITPLVTFNQALYDYNLYIRDTLVPTYAGNGHKVSTVDLYSLFLVDPNDYSSAIAPNVLANNINHPDNPRYDLMAREWFEGIEALGIGPTFNSWISNYPGVGAQIGLNDDPDGDGIDNGVENFFGTHPGEFSQGLIAGAFNPGAGTFTFTHPQGTLAGDLTAAYQWSKDLSDFHADGGTDGGGTRVDFTAAPDTPTPGTTTVTATVTGIATSEIFIRVQVTQD